MSASNDRTLRVWDLASGRSLQTLEGHSDGVRAVAVTPDGTRAVSASDDGTLRVWDLASGRALRTLEGHSHGVRAVAVTPDGTRAVSASYDGTLRVWDLASGALIASFHADGPILCVTCQKPDVFVAGSTDGGLHILELRS